MRQVEVLSPGHTAPDNDPITMQKISLSFKIHIQGHTAAITINLSLNDNDNDFRIALQIDFFPIHDNDKNFLATQQVSLAN